MIVARLFSTANGSNGAQWRRKTVRFVDAGRPVEQVCAERICDVGEERQYEGSAGLDLPEINLSLTPIDLVEGQLANVTGAQSVPSSQHKDRIVAPAERR